MRIVNYRNTTLFIAGIHSFGLVCYPLFVLVLKPIAYLFGNGSPYSYFSGAFLLPLLIWPTWLLILLCRKTHVSLHFKTRLSMRELAIMAALLFLHLGAMDQIRELLMTSAGEVTDYKTGLYIWYVCSLVLEIYFVIQLICSAPVQRWVQRKYVRIICLVFIGLVFFLLVVWILLYPPYKSVKMVTWRIKAGMVPMMDVAFLAAMCLLQPWFVYFFTVVIRAIRNLIRRDKTWKEVFLFPNE